MSNHIASTIHELSEDKLRVSLSLGHRPVNETDPASNETVIDVSVVIERTIHMPLLDARYYAVQHAIDVLTDERDRIQALAKTRY